MGFTKLFRKAEAVAANGSVAVKKAQIAIAAPDRPLSAKVLELECRIKELLREPHLYDRFFVPISKEFYSICWGFPGSNGNHHPGRLGLIEHSLGVVVRMLRDAPLVREGLVDGEREKFAIHCLLCGLGHDLGKTLEWKVESRGYDYSPLCGSVRDQGFTAVYHRNTGRHQILSTVVVNRLLTAGPYINSKLYDPRELGLILDAIVRHHDPAIDGEAITNPYLSLVRKSDTEDAAADMVVVPTEAEISLREEVIVRDREEVRHKQVDIAIRAIKLVLGEAKYGDGWYLTENGWLLVVAPRWVDQQGQGIYQYYTQLFGREVRPYDLWSLLRDAGVLLAVEDDNKDFRRLRISKSGSKTGEKSLTFAVFAEETILSDVEAEGLDRYQVKGLAAVQQKSLREAKPEQNNGEKETINVQLLQEKTDEADTGMAESIGSDGAN